MADGTRKAGSYQLCLVFIFMLAGIECTVAQEPITFEKTLEYLNHKFDGKCSFKEKKRYVEVCFLKGGEAYRIDKIYLRDLDPETIEYSEEEEAVIVRCKDGVPECIEREIIHLKKIDSYNRLNLAVSKDDKKSIQGVEAAMTHLIKLSVYSDHERTTPFE